MSYLKPDVRSRILDAAMQIIFAAELIDDSESATSNTIKAGQIKLDIATLRQTPIRSWAGYLINSRKIRLQNFGASLFSDPGWDILLQILVSEIDGKPISVSSASVVSDTPMTTGLRWVNRLEEGKLIQRIPDSDDRRVFWLRLTPKALQLLTRQFAKEIEAIALLGGNSELGELRTARPMSDD